MAPSRRSCLLDHKRQPLADRKFGHNHCRILRAFLTKFFSSPQSFRKLEVGNTHIPTATPRVAARYVACLSFPNAVLGTSATRSQRRNQFPPPLNAEVA